MNNFAQKQPTMERRGAVQRGGGQGQSPQKSFGASSNNMNGNSFAQRGGRGGFGNNNNQQPIIGGDFMNDDQGENFGNAAQSFGGGFNNNRGGGGSNSRFGNQNRPPTGDAATGGKTFGRQGNNFDNDPYRDQAASSAGFQQNNQRMGSSNTNMSKTFTGAGASSRGGFGAAAGGGFGRGGGGNRAGGGSNRGGGGSGFSNRGGRGGGGNDSGLNRYGSQNSLAQSSMSYGNQEKFGGGGSGMNRMSSINQGPSQMGRGMGGSFRPPTGGSGFGRQNSMGGGFQNKFSGTMNSRGGPQQRSSMGFGKKQEVQTNEELLYDEDFMIVIQHMAQTINQASSSNNQQPAQFFEEYGPWANRAFEDWELQIMFDIPLDQADYFISKIDDSGSRQVPIGLLFAYLYQFVPQLDISEINREQQSIWEKKKNKMIQKKDLQQIIDLAKNILNEFSQHQSYKDAFDYINSQYNDNEPGAVVMPADFLTQSISSMINNDEQKIKIILNYICLGRSNNQIFVVHFVRAMQVLMPDSMTRENQRASSPDLMGNQSINRSMTSFMEGADLNQMLMKIDERPPNVTTNPIMKKLAEHLDANSSDMAKLDSAFPSAKLVHVKTDIGRTAEVQCCTKKDFEAFLKGLKVMVGNRNDKPLLEIAQVNVLQDMYAAELPAAAPAQALPVPQQQPTQMQFPVQNSRSVQEASVEEEQDALEGAPVAVQINENPLGVEEKKGNAAFESNPFKRADTDFDRADSVEQLDEAIKPAEDSKAQEPMIVDQKAAVPVEEEKKAPVPPPIPAPAQAATVEEQKEGGEIEEEFYEGGNSDLINLEKFRKDIEAVNTLTREKAKELILEIYERIKKWITLTTKSIKLLFRNQDKKKKMEVNENDLRLVLNKAVRPFKVERKHLQAILQVMGDGQKIKYERFTGSFFAYSNEQRIDEYNQLNDIMDVIKEFKENKSLVALLSRTDDNRIRDDPDFKFEVPFKTFSQKIRRHHGRHFEVDKQQEAQLEKLICQQAGVVDLVKLQELIGFEEQELYDVQGNQYRKIAMQLQLKLTNFDQVRQSTIGGSRQRNLMPKEAVANNWISSSIIEINSDEEYNQLMGMMQEYDDGHQNDVNVQKFLGRLEREMTKYAQIQRFYLLIMKKQDDRKKKMYIEFEDIEQFLQTKGMDINESEISMDDFKALLLEMSLIGNKDENWEYFREDFFPENEPKVELKKFETDYKEIFENIGQVVYAILEMLDGYCKNWANKDQTLKDQLTQIQRINQVQLLSARDGGNRRNKDMSQSIMWLHCFDFQRWFQTQIIPFFYNNNYNPPYDREVLNTFTLYMSRSEDQKNMIFMPFLLQTYIERFPDLDVEQQLSVEALPTLVRYVCKSLARINKKPKQIFYQAQMNEQQFIQMLDEDPFNTSNECEFPTSLKSVVQNYIKTSNPGRMSYQVNVQHFKQLLKDQIKKLTMRSQELLKIRKQLDERGTKIEQALQQVKGSNDQIEDQGIELIDLVQLCRIAEVKLNPETQLIPIMDTFDKDLFGEIPASDLIYAFNNAHIGMFEEKVEDEEEPLVNAKRYFVTQQEIIDEICAEIDDRNMTDFGTLLKGNDLFNEGKITQQRFFQVLKSVFNDTLGEGDILDMIKFFDQRDTGDIYIRDVQKTFNMRINNRSNQIKLVSWVDQCVEENIVEPTSPRSKAKKSGEEKVDMPEHYRKQMLLDIHCGSLVKSNGDLQIWFSSYGSFKKGQLSKSEFVIGLERLGVEDSFADKEDAFRYFCKSVAMQQDKMMDFHNIPISSQNLLVHDLVFILNEDMPAITNQIIQDRLLWKIAQWLTDKKHPIIDILKKYEMPNEGALIDVNTFAVNVLEEDLKMKDTLTRNMIQILVGRYDRGETKFDYRNFTNDLEILEETNPNTIRIFKTQAEINFFQTQGLDDGMDAESYKRNRVLIEPLKEPAYESLTHKNTYYRPALEEVSGYMNASGSMQNTFMMEGNVSMDRPMTPPNQAPRPLLEFSQQVRMDELIIQTRTFGVSIEGYFQRFGKFSTQDGIRKIDNKQFRDAIANLDGMEWAREKPYIMDQLFDAIIIAFENFNQTKQSVMLDGTIKSNPTSWDNNSIPDKEVALDQGVPKLTLEQLGQIAYHNSSVDLDMIEATVLQNLHAVLFEQGMLDKLQDMVTFMNWERDSSCTIDQFKNLLMDTMNLQGHIKEERVLLLLQRYRQDEYSIAKEQRNDLAGLNANRREVIKKGFQNRGKYLIQILGCYHDLGYQQRKIGVKDQWASIIAEDIVKAYQVKLFEDSQLPMTDLDVPGQMHAYFLRMCQSHADTLTLTDFGYILTSMQLWDGQVHPRSRLEDFFKICQKEELAESSFFTPNTMDLSQLNIPQYIPTQQFVKAFEFLARKPLSYMYQDIIDKFYVISKRQHISIWGHTILHMFDYDDIEETGYIQLEHFVQRIQEFLNRKVIRGNSVVSSHISDHDLRFLATKYMQRDGSGMVHYVSFLDSYDQIEQCGLGGAGMNQLSLKDTSFRRDTALKQTEGRAQTWKVKTLSELSPPESKQLYEKMGQYLSKKGLIEPLCLSLVNVDPERNGFSEKHIIGDVVNRKGMKLSSKQLSLLTQVLIMNAKQEHSYLEMIALLAGEAMMHQVMRENGIQFGGTVEKPKQIDMSLLQMSKELQDQIELKYNFLNSHVQSLTRGSQQIRDQELFKVLKEADISFDMADIDTLEQYLTFQRNKENNTINYKVFLEHFKIQTFTSDMLVDIVRQLTEKKVVIEEVTSKRRFSFEEFKELMDRIGVRITDDRVPTLQKLFEQMSEGQEDLSRARMVQCFGIEFTNIGKPQQKGRNNNRTLPEPPMAVNELLVFLVNKKINVLHIFTESLKSKRIKIVQLRELLDQHNYPLQSGDFEIVVKFFRPPGGEQPNSARSGENTNRQNITGGDNRRGTFGRNQSRGRSKTIQQNQGSKEDSNTLHLGKIVTFARRIDPNYGKDEAVPEGASKTVITSFPQRIKQILKRFSEYMIDNQMTKEGLFEVLDRNNDGKIALNELTWFATVNSVIEGLQGSDIEMIFSFLDSNQDGSISINEFCMLIQGVTLSMENRLKSFSFEFDAQLKTEIETLFERLDTDRNQSLTADELVQMSRPTDKSGSITLTKAHEIIRQLDTDGNGRISRVEFVKYFMPRQKRQILDFEDQMEDLRRLFKEQIAEGVASDPTENRIDLLNNNQFITKDGLKSLIVKSGYKSISNAEIDSIFIEMDADKDGTIDIDEFIAFIQVADRVKTKNTQARDAVFNIRKARLKLNSIDLFEMFLKMPLSFLPSYSMREIEHRKHNLPIHGIQFHFNHQSMTYAGLEKIKDLRAKQDQPKLYIAQYKPKVGLEVSLTGEAINVPLVQKLKAKYDLPHFEVRVVLFDMVSKVYLSNFYILGAEAIRKSTPKNKSVVEDQQSTNLRYDASLAAFYIASDQLENVNASLVIEFVIYGNNTMALDPTERQEKSNQITVAWSHIPVPKLQTTVKHKVDLKGGNPFQEQELITTEDSQQPKSGKSLLKKIFGGSQDNSKIHRYFTLEAKPLNKLPEQVQLELSSLPSSPQSCIVCKPLLSLVVTFRNHCFLLLTKHQQEMTQPNLDLVMVQFPKIYNNPDFQAALAQCWSGVNFTGENASVLSENKLETLNQFVQMAYSVMFEYNIKLDPVYPTRSSPLNQRVYRARQIALKQTLMGSNEVFMQKVRGEILADNTMSASENIGAAAVEPPQEGQTLFMEDYVPFGMGELCGNANGFDGDDAVVGLSVFQEQTVNEMERKYAADGLYI